MSKSRIINRIKKKNITRKYQATLDNEEIIYSDVQEVLDKLYTFQGGLATTEVNERLIIYGYNRIETRTKRFIAFELLARFKNPVLLLLFLAGLISGLLGDITGIVIISIIIIISILLEYYQENKSGKAAELLKEKVSNVATALRDGRKQKIRIEEIVPGDIIFLSAGDMIPADARPITTKELYVNESTLTGESFPVEKFSKKLEPQNYSLSEWKNYLFMGSSVISGSAIAVIVRTGMSTEYGKIAKRLVETSPATEFQVSLRKFSLLIVQITFLLVILVFFINILYNRGFLDSLLFSVALAVGLTPELLPMIISINLSKGAFEMSKKGVIVKRLGAMQNFGSMDILCTDKTGTLTQNNVTVVANIDYDGKDDLKVYIYSYINSFYQTGLKSPLDEAILQHKKVNLTGYSKVDEIPFDFNRKRVSVAVDYDNKMYLISKGAPEEILKVCSHYEEHGQINAITAEIRNMAEVRYYNISSEGYRSLAIAYKIVESTKTLYKIEDENDLIFLGFVTFIDPPKPTAIDAMHSLHEKGVSLKIITGDNEYVTRKICEQLNFDITNIITGVMLDKMTDGELLKIIESTNVFARVTPAQKSRIITVIKKNNHVVGFLGDGVNDTPSMKVADVSISVDNAVDVAKETADIILVENNLNLLSDGVAIGRKTFGNTLKYIIMGTSSNFGNMFSMAGATLFLPFLPMLPEQILLNNLIYDVSQTTIPADNVDEEFILTPKRLDIRFIRNSMLFFGPIGSFFDFLTFFIVYFILHAKESLFQTSWFLVSLTCQILIVFVIRTTKIPFFTSRPHKLIIFSSLIMTLFVLIVPFTLIGSFFKFVTPDPIIYLVVGVILILYIISLEITKKFFYRWNQI